MKEHEKTILLSVVRVLSMVAAELEKRDQELAAQVLQGQCKVLMELLGDVD